MDRPPFEQELLLYVEAIAYLGLCVRLLWTRLYRTYPYFFSYLVLSLIQLLAVAFLPLHSVSYLRVWMVSEALTISAYAMVVLETYGIVLSGLAGIASIARGFLKIALGVAASASLLLLGFEATPAQLPGYFTACERVIVSSLLLLVLFSLGFLAYYPVPLHRNALYYSVGFAVYLLTKTATLFAGNLRYYWWYRQVSTSLLAVCCACLLFWLFTLSRKGEQVIVSAGHRWSPEDEQRVLSSLRSINDELLGSQRK